MVESSLIVLGLFVLTQIVKKYISPKFGSTGVHVFVFAVAFVVVVVQGLMEQFPTFGAMVLMAGKYLAGAMMLYEVVWKRLNESLNIV